MTINNDLLSAIEEKINELGSEYEHSQGLILTEDDLKCNLYSKLIQIPCLAISETTKDHWIKGCSVHAELSWFDIEGRLTIKPDLTILDPRNLSITHSLQDGLNLPNKGFHFVGDAIIFELKFIRAIEGPTESTLRPVRNDVAKIKLLYEKIKHDSSSFTLLCYIVFFSKFNKGYDLVERIHKELSDDDRFRVFHKSGNVSLNDPSSKSEQSGIFVSNVLL